MPPGVRRSRCPTGLTGVRIKRTRTGLFLLANLVKPCYVRRCRYKRTRDWWDRELALRGSDTNSIQNEPQHGEDRFYGEIKRTCTGLFLLANLVKPCYVRRCRYKRTRDWWDRELALRGSDTNSIQNEPQHGEDRFYGEIKRTCTGLFLLANLVKSYDMRRCRYKRTRGWGDRELALRGSDTNSIQNEPQHGEDRFYSSTRTPMPCPTLQTPDAPGGRLRRGAAPGHNRPPVPTAFGLTIQPNCRLLSMVSALRRAERRACLLGYRPRRTGRRDHVSPCATP